MLCGESFKFWYFPKGFRKFDIENGATFLADQMPVVFPIAIETGVDNLVHSANDTEIRQLIENAEDALPGDGGDDLPNCCPDLVDVGMAEVIFQIGIDGKALLGEFAAVRQA